MFVNIAPSAQSAPESLCSLRFAAKVNACEVSWRGAGGPGWAGACCVQWLEQLSPSARFAACFFILQPTCQRPLQVGTARRNVTLK